MDEKNDPIGLVLWRKLEASGTYVSFEDYRSTAGAKTAYWESE